MSSDLERNYSPRSLQPNNKLREKHHLTSASPYSLLEKQELQKVAVVWLHFSLLSFGYDALLVKLRDLF